MSMRAFAVGHVWSFSCMPAFGGEGRSEHTQDEVSSGGPTPEPFTLGAAATYEQSDT